MRIASLLPSATEIVCALGLADSLVGVSHECDYPAAVVARLPRLTRSAIPAGLAAAEVDQAVAERLHRGESLYLLEGELLAELQPDLLITQELCDVCAVSYNDVCNLARWLPGNPQVISLTPPDLPGIWADVRTVAAATGTEPLGQQLIAQLQERLTRVAAAVAGRVRPRVFALEWLDPPFAAGHWVPEMIALAGGAEVLGRAGEKSFRTTWAAICAAAPEVIVLMPCGYSAEAAEQEWAGLPKPSGWAEIPAVRAGRVYAVDANSYCSRPAPRVVAGIEQLAQFFHPDVALYDSCSETP